MRAKKRVLYIPDEDTLLLDELIDTPRPRPSRLSRIAIFSSDGENGATPVDNGTGTSGLADVDRALLVSYNSYALADGTGALRPPLTTKEAMELYRSLRKCCNFLSTFLERKSVSQTSTDCMSSSSLCSSEYDDSLDSEMEIETRRRRRQKFFTQRRTPLTGEENYAELTVLELRELLRERNLPISGTKALLVSRLVDSNKKPQEIETNGAAGSTVPESPDVEHSAESSFFSAESKEEENPRTVWGAILNMGSKLFRKSTGSFSDNDGDRKLCRKRQRSA